MGKDALIIIAVAVADRNVHISQDNSNIILSDMMVCRVEERGLIIDDRVWRERKNMSGVMNRDFRHRINLRLNVVVIKRKKKKNENAKFIIDMSISQKTVTE